MPTYKTESCPFLAAQNEGAVANPGAKTRHVTLKKSFNMAGHTAIADT
jgi:hypothetical protein